jgi:sarcosine oxidase subunit beta
MVTEPLKPILSATISSPKLHAYAYQTDRGEIVIGGPVDPYPTFSQKSTLFMLEELATFVLELLPCLRDVNILRQWTGLCDMTPDYAPIMGFVEAVEGLILNCGWGTWGFKAAPISGKTIAELITNNKVPDLIKPFALSRFEFGRLVNEKASATAAALH